MSLRIVVFFYSCIRQIFGSWMHTFGTPL